MGTRFVFGVLGLVASLCVANAADPVEAPALDYLYQLNDDGSRWTTESFRGQLTVVNFWATWCPPCIDEMPMLEEFHREFKDRGARVVAVTKFFEVETGEKTEAEELDSIRELFESTGATFPGLIAGDASPWDSYSVSGVPSTVLVDENGNIVASAKGKKGTKKILKKARKMLETDDKVQN